MAIQAVLFDLDNTLTHRANSIASYSKTLVTVYESKLKVKNIEHIQAIIHRIDNGGYPKKELLTHASIGASVAYALQTELEWEEQPNLEELTDFWFNQFGEHAVAMQGAHELLNALKQKGYKLAVISNGGHKTRLNILNGLGFTPYFDEIISSELIGISKPQPEIFIQTSQRLGVKVENCLFVGDHPINDILGATNAGMMAILIEGFHQPEFHIEHKIQNLNELWKFL